MVSIDAVKCRLRAVEPSDVEVMYLWENDPELWRVSGTCAPLSREQLMRFVEEQQYDIYATRQMRLIIDVEGVAVGAIDLFDFEPRHRRLGVGILIYSPEERRRGYARAAVEAIKRYAHDTLGLRQIWATMTVDNAPSISLFEGCGFERCGVRRAWVYTNEGFKDEAEYQCLFE